MNLKNDEFLMLVVAFLLGYFAHRILKGCRLLEGIENGQETQDDLHGSCVNDFYNKCSKDGDFYNDMELRNKCDNEVPIACPRLPADCTYIRQDDGSAVCTSSPKKIHKKIHRKTTQNTT